MKAHIKCLENTGEDIKKLRVIEENVLTTQKIESKTSIKVVEKIPYTDAKVDIEKMKDTFVNQNIMDKKAFDLAFKCLVESGFMTKDFIVTKAGKEENMKTFKTYYTSKEFTSQREHKEIDTTKLLFND